MICVPLGKALCPLLIRQHRAADSPQLPTPSRAALPPSPDSFQHLYQICTKTSIWNKGLCPEVSTISALHSSIHGDGFPSGEQFITSFLHSLNANSASQHFFLGDQHLPRPTSLHLQAFHLPNMWCITEEPTETDRHTVQPCGFVGGGGKDVSFLKGSVKNRNYQSTV